LKKLVCLLLVLGCGSAWAIPVTWTLNNVVFDDGGIASGSFTVDADTNEVTNVNVFTTTGTTLTGVDYSDSLDLGGCCSNFVNLTLLDDGGNLFLIFDSPLTNGGGMMDLVVTGTNCINNACGIRSGVGTRLILSGSATAVPLTAAAWLFGSGLGLLGWMRRRQLT